MTSKESSRPDSAARPAALVLADGRVYRGTAFGAAGRSLGEAVFSTGMTGYQETLTDPSYFRQIVVATAPHIGNTGWNNEDSESLGSGDKGSNNTGKIWVAGLVVREVSRRVSNWRSQGSLEDQLETQGIVGIRDIDTRAVVRHLRTAGSMKAGVFSGESLLDDESMVAAVREQPAMAGLSLADEVSTQTSYTVPAIGTERFIVAALDLGIKTNTPRMLSERGITVKVLPASTTIADIEKLSVDGVFLSNGPGDPATADSMVELTSDVLRRGYPLFGICFGNQILGRALGLSTYKMTFGHRGINIPVIDNESKTVAITAQNHGFALEGTAGQRWQSPFGPAKVTHTCANDGTVEGVALEDGSAFSVQYHPEAAAGPHDAAYLFDQFIENLARFSERSAGKAAH